MPSPINVSRRTFLCCVFFVIAIIRFPFNDSFLTLARGAISSWRCPWMSIEYVLPAIARNKTRTSSVGDAHTQTASRAHPPHCTPRAVSAIGGNYGSFRVIIRSIVSKNNKRIPHTWSSSSSSELRYARGSRKSITRWTPLHVWFRGRHGLAPSSHLTEILYWTTTPFTPSRLTQ